MTRPEDGSQVQLSVVDGRLSAELRPDSSSGSSQPIRVAVDFVTGAAGFARRKPAASRADLFRALGISKGRTPLVFDAFAGLGRDGFAIAEAGCRVVMCERNPVVAALLEDGLRRAAESDETSEAAARVRLFRMDAGDLMRDWGALVGERPAVIYLDPMYPESNSTASVKKESRLLRLVTDADPPMDEEMLGLALGLATARVVVKRPKSAFALPGPRPSGAVSAKATRWDIYGTVG